MSMDFSPPAWSYDANIYEVNLRQYTPEGSFRAFAGELPRLRDMGIDILWFMPVTPISLLKRKGTLGSYYACSDYTATNPEFGSVADFKDLVTAAHGLGFRVIIDWVANHTGWDHRWTRSNPDYYVRDGQGNFTERNGWDDVIDLDFSNGGMRKALIEAMRFWITECDIDGFRCDMAHLVVLDFWKEARSALQSENTLFWLAECEEISYHAAFDATYTWKWMHRTEQFAKQQTGIDGLWEQLMEYNHDFPSTAFRAYFTSNHDENSWNGTEYEKYGDEAINFAVFSCTWNGLPLIYSGQEVPNMRRLKFFDKDPITWTGSYALHDFYKILLSLRKRNPALRAGDDAVSTHRIQTNAPGRVFSFLRTCANRSVLVLLNFSGEAVSLELNGGQATGHFTNPFSGEFVEITDEHVFDLQPWGYLVLEQ